MMIQKANFLCHTIFLLFYSQTACFYPKLSKIKNNTYGAKNLGFQIKNFKKF